MVVVAGGTVGEFRHVERADVERAGCIEPLERSGGLGRRPALADLRAAVRHLPRAVEHVLVRERYAGQWTVAALGVPALSADERVDARLPELDARAARFLELLRRERAAVQLHPRLGERQD